MITSRPASSSASAALLRLLDTGVDVGVLDALVRLLAAASYSGRDKICVRLLADPRLDAEQLVTLAGADLSRDAVCVLLEHPQLTDDGLRDRVVTAVLLCHGRRFGAGGDPPRRRRSRAVLAELARRSPVWEVAAGLAATWSEPAGQLLEVAATLADQRR